MDKDRTPAPYTNSLILIHYASSPYLVRHLDFILKPSKIKIVELWVILISIFNFCEVCNLLLTNKNIKHVLLKNNLKITEGLVIN